jgi:2-polyprenyl-6-methoxyphenol hydroxylase-like FAD-dependent oxidoreductase
LAEVQITGNGIAALSIAQLLSQSGIAVSMQSGRSKHQRSVLLSSQTVQLLSTIHRTDRFARLGWPVQRRSVLWGDAAEPVTVEHHGISIAEALLVEELRSHLPGPPTNELELASSGWVLETQLRNSEAVVRYGERRAIFHRAKLRTSADAHCCFAESTATGWLFLLPTSFTEAVVICCGYHPEEVLPESRFVMLQVEDTSPNLDLVSIAPAMARELVASGLIRTGSAALQFDPLCGEGVGHAAREAYLATAVVRAANRGEQAQELLAHYATRLQQAFLRHLLVCRSFYAVHQESAFWRSELTYLEAGIAALQTETIHIPVGFRFEDLDLKPVIA